MKDIELLYQIAQKINAPQQPFRKILSDLMSLIAECYQAQKALLNILDIVSGQIQIESAYGLSETEKTRGTYKIGEGIIGQVVSEGSPIIVEDLSREPRFLYRTQSPFSLPLDQVSFVCVPIKVQEDTIGTLSLFVPRKTSAELADIMKTLSVISNMIATHIDTERRIKAEKESLLQENIHLKEELYRKFRPHNIIGNSSKMLHVFELIKQVAHTQTTVLIRGESGTGKELVASAIHYNSPFKDGPFIKVNCSAIPANLLESELFGYEKGAFTGALNSRKGMFELAQNGSIFLDEIGEMEPSLQAKLLRVLQEKDFYRVGGTQPIKCHFRVIAATHKNLEEAVEKGTFRADLYYRLNVFPIYLPPLRERGADILLLADYFVEKYSKMHDKPIKRISTPAIDMLMSYHWPGNVRELENCIERAVIISDDEVIHSHHLPPTLQTADISMTQVRKKLPQAVETLEKELIVEALKETRGNISKAAEILGITQRVLNYKIKKYQIPFRLYRRKEG